MADIYKKLPAENKPMTAILIPIYGGAGVFDLYRPVYGRAEAINGMNNHYLHGYGDLPPQIVILVGAEFAPSMYFKTCQLAGRTKNPYSIQNEEIRAHSDVMLCRGLRRPWSEFWKSLQTFG